MWKHAVNNDMTQQYYLELVTDAFEKHGIDYMILKGLSLAKLYPTTDCRQSGDCDIYVGKDTAEIVQPIMEELGFTTERIDEYGHHDVYRIDKLGMFELHHDLVDKSYKWEKTISKSLNRLVKVDGYEHCYTMTPEDFYVYTLCHAAKHVARGGSGIKSMLDLWLYTRCYKDKLDYNKLNSFLEECGVLKFHMSVMELCDMWFEGKDCTHAYINDFAHIIAIGGCYGDEEAFNNADAAKSFLGINTEWARKLYRYFKVTFYPLNWMQVRYPVLKKMPVLLPACWIHRAVNAIINKQDVINGVRTAEDNKNIEEGIRYNEVKANIGI